MSEIKDFFQENGYYVARGVYSPSEVKDLERDFDRREEEWRSLLE